MMNRQKYHEAFDRISFRPDFNEKTVQALLEAVGPEKERSAMKTRIPKTALLAAALCAILIVTAAAATGLLSARDVASQFNDPLLADAFESPNAILINQCVESNGYRFTLAGLVSGADISSWCSDAVQSRTYVVASLARTDGQPVGDESFSFIFTPLVSGYEPWRVNAWTLNGGRTSKLVDGVAYYLFDCQDIEIFADHTVYLAAYDGTQYMAPCTQLFRFNEDGSIEFQDGIQEAHALFTLPLDASKADPAAVEALIGNLFDDSEQANEPTPDSEPSVENAPDSDHSAENAEPDSYSWEHTENFTILPADT